MKNTSFVCAVLLTLSCSSSKDAAPVPPTTDAGTDAAKPADPYVEAVKAAQWAPMEKAPKLSQGKMDDVFFIDENVGFAVSGQTSSVLKTTDGGASWKSVLKNNNAFFRALLFTSDQHGFVGNLGAGLAPDISDANVLYETKDGGTTWAPVTNITGSTPKGICNLSALDAKHLIAVGRTNGPAHVIMSSDGGANWVSTDVGNQLSMLIDAHYVSASEAIIVGMNKPGAGAGAASSCTALRTTDGGKTYSTVFTSKAAGSLCWKVDFPSKDIGYIAVQQKGEGPPSFAKTIDGGKTWEELPLPAGDDPAAPYPTLALGFVNDKIGWAVSEDPDLPSYRTYDGGLTWEVDAIKAPINRFRFINARTGYAIGGTIWKLSVSAQ